MVSPWWFGDVRSRAGSEALGDVQAPVRPERDSESDALGEERRHLIEGQRGGGRALMRSFDERCGVAYKYGEATLGAPSAGEHGRDEDRVGMGGGVPVGHLDVGEFDGLRDEAVEVRPGAILEGLEDHLPAVFDELVAPTGLLGLASG